MDVLCLERSFTESKMMFCNMTDFLQNLKCLPCMLTEVRRVSQWTQWVRSNTSRDGSYRQERYRMVCKGHLASADELRIQVKSMAQDCPGPDGERCGNSGEGANPASPNRGHGYSQSEVERREETENRPLAGYVSDGALRAREHQKWFRGYCGCRDLGVYRVCLKCVHDPMAEHLRRKDKLKKGRKLRNRDKKSKKHNSIYP